VTKKGFNRRGTAPLESNCSKKDEDTAEATCDARKKVLMFDLQKILPPSSLSTGVNYYKHQIWKSNL
jgi:hypothetical protein